MNKELHSKILDLNFSGSTCVALYIKGQQIYAANVGDSRAIICSLTNDGINQ